MLKNSVPFNCRNRLLWRSRSPTAQALVAARRRKTTKFEDSIISGTDIKTNTVFGSTGGGVVNTGENSLQTLS